MFHYTKNKKTLHRTSKTLPSLLLLAEHSSEGVFLTHRIVSWHFSTFHLPSILPDGGKTNKNKGKTWHQNGANSRDTCVGFLLGNRTSLLVVKRWRRLWVETCVTLNYFIKNVSWWINLTKVRLRRMRWIFHLADVILLSFLCEITSL